MEDNTVSVQEAVSGVDLYPVNLEVRAMYIDAHYLRELLGVFRRSSKPFTNINHLEKSGFDCDDDVFLFHMQLLEDTDLLRTPSGKSLGYTHSDSGVGAWLTRDMRLTAKGHDLAAALDQDEVWDIIKNEFRNEGLSMLMKIALTLAETYAMKRIDLLRNERSVLEAYSIDMDQGTI